MVIPSDLQVARALALWLLGQVNRIGYGEACAFAIRLALEEGLCNAVKHGNKLDPSKLVEVEYDIDQTRARITISDEGEGFKPDEIPDPRTDENLEKPSGRGIMLMRAYMDEVRFDRGGSRVSMVKRTC